MEQSQKSYALCKRACYVINISTAAVINISPLLFVAFHAMYGISYTLLGTLVLINFCTQLALDLIFSFFSKHFPLHTMVRLMPVVTIVGFLIYAILPPLCPDFAFIFLSLGTVVFACSSGLSDVLSSSLIAAIPSETPERDMSKLHSTYAWGSVLVVVVSTLFLWAFGTQHWYVLMLFWTIVPLISFLLFLKAELPPMSAGETKETVDGKIQNRAFGIFLCVVCIFLGGAAENTMSQWCSGYLESALGIPKVWGDVLGFAGFAVMLGLGRTLYAKYGKNILNVLLISMLSSTACYLVAGASGHPVIGIVACALTGFAVSMLWPGTLIVLGEEYPKAGVAAYALMASGGDMGSSLGPQMVGAVVDGVGKSDFAQSLATKLHYTPEQIGMRTGLLLSAVFPLVGFIIVCMMKKYFAKKKKQIE